MEGHISHIHRLKTGGFGLNVYQNFLGATFFQIYEDHLPWIFWRGPISIIHSIYQGMYPVSLYALSCTHICVLEPGVDNVKNISPKLTLDLPYDAQD